jgi:hypothetical protein
MRKKSGKDMKKSGNGMRKIKISQPVGALVGGQNADLSSGHLIKKKKTIHCSLM